MMDITKAFYKIRHFGLIYKMDLPEIGQEMSSLINNFIINKTYWVRKSFPQNYPKLRYCLQPYLSNNNITTKLLTYADDTAAILTSIYKIETLSKIPSMNNRGHNKVVI